MRDIGKLESESVGSLIWKFSIPAIVGMIANASYNVVDRIFVGRAVGTDAISGITLTFPIVMLILAFCMLIGIGSTALISIRLGEKNIDEAEHILGNAIFLCVAISILLAFPLFYYLDPILNFFGATGSVYTFASDYTHIVVFGIIFQVTSFSLNAIIRGEGNPRIAMFTMLIGAFANVLLDYIFIFKLGWGIKGAAWATVASQFISMSWVLYYFLGKKSLLKIKLNRILPSRRIILGIFSIGVSPFMMHLASGSLFALLNHKFLFYGGEVAVAAMGIDNSVVMFILMPIFGLNQGIQPIIGYNYGAKQYKRVRSALLKGMFYATLICLVGFIGSQIFAEHLISIFSSSDHELIAVGSRGLHFFTSMMPLVGFQVILGAYFQAIGMAKKALVLTLTRQIIFSLPLMIILPIYFGLDGLWSFSPVSDFLSAIIGFSFLFFELRRLDGLIKNNKALTNF